ncbi:pra1 family protein b4 [Quercus suber]|uniref:Pra1 family protein b4 n=1 Tax=Quercus suber TaxID=58331 RepID=A0AAW0LKX5_QUESU
MQNKKYKNTLDTLYLCKIKNLCLSCLSLSFKIVSHFLSPLSPYLSLSLSLSLLAAWTFRSASRHSRPHVIRLRDRPLALNCRRRFPHHRRIVFLISVLMLCFAIVCAHGAFRVQEDLFLDDQEPANSGFLSVLGCAASSSAAASVRPSDSNA